MVGRPLYHLLLIPSLLLLPALKTAAQPLLPDIGCQPEGSTVTVHWNNQYNGVQNIAVIRAADSLGNFVTIGNLKKPPKGVLSFTDEQPVNGRNYYKLKLTFSSGVNWVTNGCSSTVTIVKPYVPSPAPHPEPVQQRKIDTVKFKVKEKTEEGYTETPRQELPRKKLELVFDDPTDRPATFIKSQYISVDATTGHIKMDLPDDLASHHYSVKFLDGQNRLITEVPKLNAQHILLDKRNFPRKGIYKFILRRDIVEYESGYISLQ